MPSPEKEQENIEEGAPEPPPESPAPAPPKVELRIVDYSTKRVNPNCSVCGRQKDRYLEIETSTSIEYTCRDCYERTTHRPTMRPAPKPSASCRKCGTVMEMSDNFCGKCGNPAVLKCSACSAEVDEEDKFCAKCGAKLFPGE